MDYHASIQLILVILVPKLVICFILVLMHSQGTLLYVAPEILSGHYNESCDIWALGIILFILLSGEVPYDFTTREELYNKVKKGKLDWSSSI